MSLPYDHAMVSRAKELRKQATWQENRLWYDFLRNYPVRFQRQKPIGQYIVDFYCHAAKLVVEIDGMQHTSEQAAAYDQQRSSCFGEYELKVIRFSNQDIRQNFSGVCEAIHREVLDRIGKRG